MSPPERNGDLGLRVSEGRLHLAMESIQAGVWSLDLDTGQTFRSAEHLRIFGDGDPGVPWGVEAFFARVLPEDRGAVESRVRAGFELGEDMSFRCRIRRPDGALRWINVTSRFEARGDGARRAAGTVVDITEAMEVERALAESEARLRVVLDETRDLIYRVDAGTGQYDYLSASCLGLTGYTREELEPLGVRGLAGLVHPDDLGGLLAALDRLEPGAAITHEYRLIRKDGSFVWVSNLVSLYRDASGRMLRQGNLREIMALKEAEASLQAAKVAAETAGRQKDHFLAVLGHELRNPLAAIRNGVGLLQRSQDPGVLREAREIIDRQTAQLTGLVDDLLDLTRISTGKVMLNRVNLDLGGLVRHTVEDHRPAFEAAGVVLETVAPAGPVAIVGDEVRTAQILGNLLSNAVKFTASGGRVRVEVLAAEGGTVVRVTDSGIGMDRTLLGRIFHPFAQGEDSLGRGQGGLGLGLALSRGLAELHGWTLDAESGGAGRGSAFTLRLPSVPAQAQEPAGTPAETPGPRRVLVVEDNPDAARSLELLLNLSGHRVALAADGAEALDRARAFLPEVVLCDIGLPDMDGYEVARRLRQDPACRRMCLVALSGYGQASDRRLALEAGFDHHITKPLDPDDLDRLLGLPLP